MTSSSFQLVFRDYEIAVSLPFDAAAEEQLVARMRQAEELDPELAQLGKQLCNAIVYSLHIGSLPPTKKQLDYALAICRELAIQLPADCIQFQDSMKAFLNRNVPEYKRRKENHSEDIE